jgi:hypothetical protein
VLTQATLINSLGYFPGEGPASLVHDQKPHTNVLAHGVRPVQRSLVILVGVIDAVGSVQEQLQVERTPQIK